VGEERRKRLRENFESLQALVDEASNKMLQGSSIALNGPGDDFEERHS
jgi:hypothetical protein